MNMDWQVESGVRTSVFISATSKDLGECRRLVSGILLDNGFHPVFQEYFAQDPRLIEEMLRDKILAVDAVISLVGHVFGNAPTINGESSGRSYTQLEYDLVCHYEKPNYIFVATDEFAQAHPIDESEDLRVKQEEHRTEVLSGARNYKLFNSLEELEGLIKTGS